MRDVRDYPINQNANELVNVAPYSDVVQRAFELIGDKPISLGVKPLSVFNYKSFNILVKKNNGQKLSSYEPDVGVST